MDQAHPPPHPTPPHYILGESPTAPTLSGQFTLRAACSARTLCLARWAAVRAPLLLPPPPSLRPAPPARAPRPPARPLRDASWWTGTCAWGRGGGDKGEYIRSTQHEASYPVPIVARGMSRNRYMHSNAMIPPPHVRTHTPKPLLLHPHSLVVHLLCQLQLIQQLLVRQVHLTQHLHTQRCPRGGGTKLSPSCNLCCTC